MDSLHPHCHWHVLDSAGWESDSVHWGCPHPRRGGGAVANLAVLSPPYLVAGFSAVKPPSPCWIEAVYQHCWAVMDCFVPPPCVSFEAVQTVPAPPTGIGCASTPAPLALRSCGSPL